VIVEGEDGYKAAKQFMKLLMPSHARRVKAYSDPVPLFQRYGAEDQLSAMYEPVVQLKSGGYLVINPTEALVSIDINSGRSTKEHGIEQTALHTNLEAAKEIARQLRLRDMAGLVVIDFIDMDHNSNVRKVERCMKDSLKNDRARIQVGRISSFGLMEMSRQRLRTGVLEASTRECPHCDGTGLVRTASSAGLSALRVIEDEAAKGKGTIITLHASTEAAVYLLNAKRSDLAEIESRYGVSVEVKPEGEDEGAKMRVQSAGPKPSEAPKFDPIVDDDDDDEESVDDPAMSDDDEDGGRKKNRRRRRRGGRGRNKNRQQDDTSTDDGEDTPDDGDSTPDVASEEDSGEKPPRRGRRGGRGRSRKAQGDDAGKTADTPDAEAETAPEAEAEAEEIPKPKRKPRSRKKADADETVAVEAPAQEEAAEDKPKSKPKAKPRARKKPAASEADASTGASDSEAAPETEEKPKPKAKPRTRKKAAPKAEAEPEVANDANGSAGTSQAEASEAGEANDGSPRRGGWWQRTFGN